MDRGADLRDGIMWVFTLGEPPEEMMASFVGLLGVGNMDWVIVPIPASDSHYFKDDAMAVIGFG